MTRQSRERAFWGLFILAILSASGARAQSYLSPGYIIGEIRDVLGIVQMPTPPEFVARARPDPAKIEYVPLKPPPRDFHSDASKPSNKLAAESGAIAELETSRARSKARAAAYGAAGSNSVVKAPVPPEGDPPPMKWNPWDTE